MTRAALSGTASSSMPWPSSWRWLEARLLMRVESSSEQPVEVLIVGAGPTGLGLAPGLPRRGIGVRIVDQMSGPATTSRAVAVQARTLEFYRQIGLADTVSARGREVSAANLWVAGRQVGRLLLGEMGEG